jgi:hypothetical protein
LNFKVVISLLILLVAYLIGNYQKANGYSFYKSFVGALMGLIGLALLAYKAFG